MASGGRNYLFNLEARGDWVRLRTLVILRWIAVAGQTGAVLLVHFGMGFELPLLICALLISASASLNVVAQLAFPAEKRLSERGTFLSLLFDLAQLVLLLMVTGGLNNPFAVLIIAPVTISATALRLQSTLWLGIAAMAAAALLSVTYLPLEHREGWVLEAPEFYRTGMAAALAIAVAFLSIYVRRISVEGYAMSQALTATQIALAREQRLAAIGGIAAATAHELGTPLATIKLAASELARELDGHPELAEDVALIRREAERCGEIMADLARGGRDDSQIRTAPVSAVIEEAAEPHRDRGKRVVVRIDGSPAAQAEGEQPLIRRSPELVHGLRNLIQNAVDFAQSTVWIDVDSPEGPAAERAELRITVGDDGPGFGADILPRLGEPYVSTRQRGARRGQDAGAGESDEYQGMGLGLFIARTLLERTGARLSFANGSDARQRRLRDPQTPAELARPPGAIIEIVWPASMVVAPRAEARRALGPNRRFGAAL